MKKETVLNFDNERFLFSEYYYDVSEYEKLLRTVKFKHQDFDIKMFLLGFDHNPPHIHIIINSVIDDEFRYKLSGEYYKKDVSGNRTFQKFKRNKKIYNAVKEYLKIKNEILTESFYILNPTLKTKGND